MIVTAIDLMQMALVAREVKLSGWRKWRWVKNVAEYHDLDGDAYWELEFEDGTIKLIRVFAGIEVKDDQST